MANNSISRFVRLNLSHKNTINQTDREDLPLSSQLFSTLFIYDTIGYTKISKTDTSVSIKFINLFNEFESYSFIGDLLSLETKQLIRELVQNNKSIINLTYSQKKQLCTLKVQSRVNRNKCEYIYNLENFKEFKKSNLKTKRNSLHRFIRLYPKYKIKILDLRNKKNKTAMMNLYNKWIRLKKKKLIPEYLAFNKLMKYHKHFLLISIGLYVSNKLIGFIVNEVINSKYSTAQFIITLPVYKGSSELLFQENARELIRNGIKIWNLQSDEGDLGLRKFKLSWHPNKLLKNYWVKQISITRHKEEDD